ncbi:MAG: RNA 2',3'-cyclic phosphodiesterase [Thermoplasmata archaeon]
MVFRAFIAVEVGDRPSFRKLAEELASSGADLKLVEPGNLHITLKFLGDTEEASVDGIHEAMKRSVGGVAPFELSFRGTGAFPDMNYIRVVWVGLSGTEPLAEIARRLDEELAPLGMVDRGGFTPHMTLARVKSRRGRERIQEILRARASEDFGSMRVERVKLKKSVLGRAGPVYSDVREVALLG